MLEFTGTRVSEAGPSSDGSNFFEQTIQFIFDDDKGLFLLGDTNGFLLLENEDIGRLRLVVQKYLDWEELATLNGIKVSKDIPDSVFSTEEVLGKTSRGQYIKEKIQFKMMFLSLSEKEHQLVIDKAKGSKNIFSFLDEPLYINKQEVLKLYSVLNEEEIEKVISEYKKKEEVKQLFN
ncbi:MAG: hypothetical protein ACYC1E_16795 [Propionibacteriaceae bacterium]